MVWIYRLQQRLALPLWERRALLAIGGLMLIGTVYDAVFTDRMPAPDYTVLDEAYAEALRQHAEAPVLPETEAAPAPLAAIPFPTEITSTTTEASPQVQADLIASVDLNTATQAELESLPRIGPKLAERVLAYREAHGGFAQVSELIRVKGIGQKTMALLTPLVHIHAQPEADD